MACKTTTLRDFKRLVNMTPSEIRRWAKSPKAKLASYASTRRRLPALARLKAKVATRKQLTSAECKFAARVVAFNKRMGAQARKNGCTVKRAVALRNWGRKQCKVEK